MALASASGLGRPSVARLGAADPSPPLSPRTADASARARAPPTGARVSRHRGRARERPLSDAPRARAPPEYGGHARRPPARDAGLTRARGRSPRECPGGERRVTRPDAPVAPPRARHAPRPRELHGRVPQETGGAAGGLRGRLVPGEHREPRAPAGKHGGRRVGGCAVRRGGGQNLQLPKPRVGASEMEPQLENGQRRLLAGDRGVPPFGARPGGVGRGPGRGLRGEGALREDQRASSGDGSRVRRLLDAEELPGAARVRA